MVISSLLLNLSFFEPHYFFWLVFIFLVPLFYVAIHSLTSITFFSGFIWGVCFYLPHFTELFFLFFQHAVGCCRLFLPCLLAIYCAFYAGMWFFLMRFFMSKVRSVNLKLLLAVGTTALYFYSMSSLIFWIFGNCCGYCFADPLIPLTAYPQLLQLLPHLGSTNLLGCVALSSYCWALVISSKKMAYLVIGFSGLIPFFVGIFQPMNSTNVSKYQQQICYVSPPTNFVIPLDCAQEISKKIQQMAEKKPGATLFLMPESSFPFSLDQMPEILELWELNALDDARLILGGYMHNEEKGSKI